MFKLYCCLREVQPAARLLWAGLLLAGLPAFAQPELVRGPQPLTPYPGKDASVTLDGKLYFAATTAAHGAELFRSDPQVKEISLVKDINPGPKSSSPGELMRLGNAFLFTAADGVYRSDGTEAGTVRLKASASWPYSLVNAGGTAFFMVDAGSNVQIWKSNGTAAGTTLVKEVGAAYSQFAPSGLTVLGKSVFFPGYDAAHGIELWQSDGTAAGTVMVKDIYPGGPADPDAPQVNSSEPGSLTAFGGALYFSASDGVRGRELWKSDGTAAGTTLVKDLAAPEGKGGFGVGNAQPAQFTVAGDALFFVITPIPDGAEVYKTDGTAAGTVRVAAHYPPRPGPGGSVFGMTAVGNTVYYGVSIDSPGFGTSVGLYKTDGTVAGSVRVYDFSGAAGGPAGFVNEGLLGNFTNVGGVLYFTANDGLTGSEVWKTDGTAAGTVYLPEVAPGLDDSNPTRLVNLNGVLFFSASADPQDLRQWKFDPGQPFTLALRINAGGGEGYIEQEPNYPNPLVPALYQYFAPDAYFSGGNVTNPRPGAPASVFEARRWGAFSYNIPVTNGTYDVNLRSIEPYWGVTVPGGKGSRSFNVDMEGIRKVTEIDLFQLAGGALVPVWQRFRVTVTDGTLNIDFTRGPADNAIISALEVLPTVAANRPPVIAAIGDTTITLGSTLTFTANATDPDGDELSFQLNGGYDPDDAVVDPRTGSIAFTPAEAGTYLLAVVVTDNGYGQAEAVERFAVTVIPEPKALRVNAGGNDFTTADARNFSADAYFSGGSLSMTTPLGIGGTRNDNLYQTGRHGAFSYNFPTGNGAYDVVLHFAETYWGNAVPGGAGSRRFHVNLEGQRKLTDYDIFARAGGALKATREVFRVNVSDGTLNVAFLKGAADNPAIKAIEVLPAGSGLTINAGGEALTTTGGKRFSADSYYVSGRVSPPAFGEIENTDDDALYLAGRVGGAFTYDLPSGNGTFDVTLHFAETYWGNQVAGGAGSRRFHVDAEGRRKLTDYDIFEKAGGAMRATQETFRATVTDGVLTLRFARGGADLPLVSAIDVTPVTGAARTAAEEVAGAAGAETVRLHPNPARTTLTVTLPFPAARVTGSAVVTATGRELLRDGHRVKGEYELEIPVAHLPAGLYLLRLRSPEGHRQVLRFVKGE